MAAKDRPILIKKVKKVSGGGHHGGAWKVAYADFVTAMMAFFLLMWLINTTTPEQKRGIAQYFAPAAVSDSASGAGGILGGTALDSNGAMSAGSTNIMQLMAPDIRNPQDGPSAAASVSDTLDTARRNREEAEFESAAQSLKQALQSMPELAELSKNIIVDKTPEGLRIQLVDQEGRSLFAEGSAVPNERARVLLRAITRTLNQLPNRISISGHTSADWRGGEVDSDWALSSARADASRRVLQAAGIAKDRVYQVSGKANSEPLYPDDPSLPGNRRIAIVLLREAPVLPPNPAF
ncbi:flagellar motor protein MotB [Phenylobacterium sp.]|uniref:flagellar motor protein MotB n=1 Tax=Phenylobacterium sp. TaxID=1871053 RepID=UPI002FDE5373